MPGAVPVDAHSGMEGALQGVCGDVGGEVADPGLFHRAGQMPVQLAVARLPSGDLVLPGVEVNLKQLGSGVGMVGIIKEEGVHLGVGGGIRCVEAVVELVTEQIRQDRHRTDTAPRVATTLGVNSRSDHDHAVTTTDLAPATAQPAEPVPERAAGRYGVDVVPATRLVGPGGLKRRRDLGHSLRDQRMQVLRVIHVEHDSA